MDTDTSYDCGPVLQAEGGEVQAGGGDRAHKRNKYICEWKDLTEVEQKYTFFDCLQLSSIKYIKMKYKALLQITNYFKHVALPCRPEHLKKTYLCYMSCPLSHS